MGRPDEVDIEKGVPCPGYGKLLILEDCKACEHFVEMKSEEVKQIESDGKEIVVDVIETIICRYPTMREVHTLCRIEKADK